MIEQHKGTVQEKTHTHAVIFVNGVGYKAMMSTNGLESLFKDGSVVHLLPYLLVREYKIAN